jgi:CubicO group peptidase (beta-lactamase class C family)
MTRRYPTATRAAAAVLFLAALRPAPLAAQTAQTAQPADVWPGARWERAAPEEMGMDRALLEKARDYALTIQGSGYVIYHGKLVMSWGDPDATYDLKSATKSFGSVALMLGVADGKVRLDEPLEECRPGVARDVEGDPPRKWGDEITLDDLATHSAGFSKRGGFGTLMYEPGTEWAYSDSGPNWLAECLTLAYGRDLRDVMFDRVFTPIGIGPEDLTWRDNQYRPKEIGGIPRREFGAGIHANVDAMARFGYLLLHQGKWRDRQLLPARLIDRFTRAQPALAKLHVHDSGGEAGYEQEGVQRSYGVLWWTNAGESMEGVPLDTYVAWGLYEGLVIVIPSMDLVIARAGPSLSWPRPAGAAQGTVLVPFIAPIVQSVRKGGGAGAAAAARAPYPPSPVIRGLEWAPKDSVIRMAEGSDNWPTTWGDDGAVYTAYGDGWGFDPRVPEKLSLGLARVDGSPPRIHGVNIRSETGEQRGGGAGGKKASGLLMVDGTLYMWARNAGNSQLAWSRDHGRSWTWADWTFRTSFGAPVFLEFGKDYSGARDGYVYVYSHDSDSAYQPADRMVLARVPKDRIADRASYEFFVKLDERGQPVWSRDIARRGAVFTNPGRAYRSGISYSPGLHRYLWYQVDPGPAAASTKTKGPDTRYEGGMGVYDAPEPWGPWTTAFYTPHWDMGPGESGNLPTAWMSPDGSTIHLVFSGDDHFSVRKATVIRASTPRREPPSGAPRAFYVDPARGQDDAAGTVSSPFRTLDRALATVGRRVDAGVRSDTIYLRGGVYRKTSSRTLWTLNLRGTPDAYTVLSAMPAKAGSPGAVRRRSGRWYEKVVFDDAQRITTPWTRVPGHPGVWRTNPGYTRLEWTHQNLWPWTGWKSSPFPTTPNDATPTTTTFTVAPYMLLQDREPFLWVDSLDQITRPGTRTYDQQTGTLYIRPLHDRDPNTAVMESWYGGPEDYEVGTLWLDGGGRALFHGDMEYAELRGLEFRMFVRLFEFRRFGYERPEDRDIQRHVRVADNEFRYGWIHFLLDSNTVNGPDGPLFRPRYSDRSDWDVEYNVFYRPSRECFQVHGDDHLFEHNLVIDHLGPWAGPAAVVGALNARNMRNFTMRYNVFEGHANVQGHRGSLFMMEVGDASHADGEGNYIFGGVTIENNLFRDLSGGEALVLGKGKVRMRNITVRDNVFDTNLNGTAIRISSPQENLVIENNVFLHQREAIGVYAPGAGNPMRTPPLPSTITIRGNVFADDHVTVDPALFDAQAGSDIRVADNLFHHDDTPPLGTGAVVGDPLFRDPGALDYRLRPGSPAIRAGIDLGAYESGGGVDAGMRWWEIMSGAPRAITPDSFGLAGGAGAVGVSR